MKLRVRRRIVTVLLGIAFALLGVGQINQDSFFNTPSVIDFFRWTYVGGFFLLLLIIPIEHLFADEKQFYLTLKESVPDMVMPFMLVQFIGVIYASVQYGRFSVSMIEPLLSTSLLLIIVFGAIIAILILGGIIAGKFIRRQK